MPKILIAGATELMADLGQTILGSDGIEHVFAGTPGAALEVARAFVPSLVVVDGSDVGAGCTFIRRLRESPGTRRSSILAVSRSSTTSESDLLRAGANLVLSGPLDPGWDARIEKLLMVARRVRMHLPVRVVPGADAGAAFPATALDVSVAGMLLETPAPLAPGATLDVHFKLPTGDEALCVTASVVRVVRGDPSHAGIRFVGPQGQAVERLQAMLASVVPEKAFGRYEVLELLGEGSMGRVYKAFDPLARRLVAIKTPRPEALGGIGAEEYLARFRREAQAAARLGHPSIVTVLDVGEDYFAMELLEGVTLETLLGLRGHLPPDEACRILRPVAEALDHAHSMGTIHRDIKPGNIMVLADGRPKVMDFGVAHLTSAVITAAGQAFGSPAYMAPEQILTGSVTPLSDVFSLAVVAYETLSGQKPFQGQSVTPVLYQVVHADPPPLSARNPALLPDYDEIFRRALAKDPLARFPSAVALLDAVEGRRTVKPSPIATPASGLKLPPRMAEAETIALRGQRRAWVLGAVAAVLALYAAGAALLRPSHPPQTPGLQVTTEPAGATVLVDGKPVGAAPLLLAHASLGNHTIRVDLKDFAPAELWLQVTDENAQVPLRFVLQPLPATLEIRSDPEPAFVKVDGGASGPTPVADLHLKPGPHDVRVERPGFQPWTQTVDLRPAESRRMLARLRSVGPGAAGRDLRGLGWVRRGDLVGLGPGVRPPEKMSGAPPAYPEAARRLGMTGSVTVEIIVSETGEALAPRIVESADTILDQAMLEAVRSWRYKPAESNGVQVRVPVRERHTFGPAR